MANMLERPVQMSIPRVVRQDGAALFQPDPADAAGAVLFLYINFAIQDRDIRGYLAVLMDVPSLDKLRVVIADFITKVVGRREANRA
jgi:chemotaxis protein CheC